MSRLKKGLAVRSLSTLALLLVAAVCLASDKAHLTVTFLDVGQGDSTVITSPAGKTVIVDGGLGGAGYKKKDKGKTVILPFLEKNKIKTVDYMVMTHPDFDHIGGFNYLLDETKSGSKYPLTIKEFLDPGYQHGTILYSEILESIKRRPELKYRNPKRGDTLDLGEGVKAEIVGPDHIYKDPNNSSIVLKITYGKISFLLTGDAETESEHDIIRNYGDALKSTVL
ncbi:MAG: MBL fold metallo-hydrolase, partial [Candidatus Aureabacteria bacterium]|nr:MBL fold metallo-hydrolase [Candidatus Auribacterota bacterium]